MMDVQIISSGLAICYLLVCKCLRTLFLCFPDLKGKFLLNQMKLIGA